MKLIGFPIKKPTQYNAIQNGEPLFTIIKINNEWKLTNINIPLTETQTKEISNILKTLNKGDEICPSNL